MNNKIIIIGAGGHGKVVAEAIQKQGKYNLLGFCDDSFIAGTMVIDTYKVICSVSQLANMDFDCFIVAIGNNSIRKKIFETLKEQYTTATIIHPFTDISKYAEVAEGSVILPGAIIAQGAYIGENCIIGSNVHVDHDTRIGEHSYIRNGSSIGSNATLAPESLTNTGENIQAYTQFEGK